MVKHPRKEHAQDLDAISERMRNLERLVEVISRGKYQWESTFDAITAPVQIVNRNYVIERANVAFAQHCGVDIRDVAGSTCFMLFADRKTPCEGCPLKAAVGASDRSTAVLKNRVRTREFEANAYPFTIGSEGTDGAVISYRDITEERRLQQEIVQQEKMAAIGILAGGVAHEINNPLGGILAFTQLLLRDARQSGNDDLVGDLKEIENAAIRCKKIVADLLDFSRVSKDRDAVEVNLNTLIESVLPFVRGEIKSLNVDLNLRLDASTPPVRGIPDRLQQVLLNLMTNACHAMPKGGILTVSTASSADGMNAIVGVCDTGTGISDDSRNKIFDPFFTTKQPGKGTGLGLSISYRIVKEHGGAITVESPPEGGSLFTVTLPASGGGHRDTVGEPDDGGTP